MPTSHSAFTFSCPSCNAVLESDAEFAGNVIECPECGAPMRIPEPPPAPEPNGKRTVVIRNSPRAPAISPLPPRSLGAARRPAAKKPSGGGGIKILLMLLIFGIAGYAGWLLFFAPPETVSAGGLPVPGGLSTDTFRAPMGARNSGGPGLLPVANADRWNLQGTANVTAFQWGSSGRDQISDIAVRPNGNLILAGIMASRDAVPAQARARHTLLDAGGTQNFGYLAELTPNGQEMLWFSTFGGDTIDPRRIALASDGSIYLGGRALSRLRGLRGVQGDFQGREAVVARISADGSRVLWTQEGGPNSGPVTGIAVDAQDRLLFAAGTRGRGQAAYVMRRNPDGSSSDFRGEFAIRFDVRTDEFKAPGQIGAFYELGSSGDGYDYDGPGGWGPVRFWIAGIREGGQIVVLPDGDFVVTGTLQYDFRELGKRRFPAFDLIVARFRPDGRLVWSTALYQEGDSIHTPDQKAKDLVLNPVNGDLYVLAIQHGSKVYRFKGDLYGNTGNLMITWIGQVDTQTGALRNGWYWMNSRQGNYTAAGRPLSPPYPSLSGNDPHRIRVDNQGRIYFVGRAAPRAWTTPNAWRDWPSDQSGGGNAALTVLTPDLSQILYATMIRGTGQDASSARALAVTDTGVWVGGTNGTPGLPAGPQPPWARPQPGDRDKMLVNFQF